MSQLKEYCETALRAGRIPYLYPHPRRNTAGNIANDRVEDQLKDAYRDGFRIGIEAGWAERGRRVDGVSRALGGDYFLEHTAVVSATVLTLGTLQEQRV